VAFAISQVKQKNIVGIVGSQYVIIAINSTTWRSIVIIKMNIKQTSTKNIIRSNIYVMLIENLLLGKDFGTWIVDTTIT